MRVVLGMVVMMFALQACGHKTDLTLPKQDRSERQQAESRS